MASLSFTLHPPPFHPLFPPTPSSSSSSSSSLLHRSTPPFPTPKPTIPPRHRRLLLPLAMNLTAASSPEDPLHRTLPNQILSHARNVFDSLPQPVKKFPWAKVLESFLGLVIDLAAAVIKWLSVPVLAVSSLSEMSYCAHERKMRVIPIPFVVGFALAGVLKDVAAEVSEEFAEGAFPWHLFMIAAFFALLKLPGPYYPYWGRLVIPHFANGGLWRSVWLIFMWYRRVQSSSLPDNDHDHQ